MYVAEIVLVTPERRVLLSGSIADDVFDDDMDADALATFLDAPGHALFVALEDGVVVGQARGCVHLQPDGPPQLYIDNLGVAPAHKRRGIATGLVRALMAWGRSQDCALVWVSTEPDNAEGLAFYRSLGLAAKTMTWFETPLETS